VIGIGLAPGIARGKAWGTAAAALTLPALAAPVVAAVTAPFRLHDLPNCVVSIRPRVATVTLNGADVSQVDDETGLGNHVVQATASKQPLWVASGGPNNKSYVEGDGVDEFLRAAFAWTQPAHIFVVAMPSATDGINKALYDGGVNNGALFYTATSTQMACYAGAGFTEAAGGTHMNTWSKIDTLWNGAASYIRRNGVTKTGNVGANNPSGIILLMRGDQASNAGDGAFAEAVGFSSEVTGNALALADWYIATEYGL